LSKENLHRRLLKNGVTSISHRPRRIRGNFIILILDHKTSLLICVFKFYRRPMVYTRPMNLRYAPHFSWLSPMPSPYPRVSQHGTPYYNPQQSDYLPSYDDVPRNHQFAFMSPSSHSSSPHSPSQSKRSIDDDSPSRHHLYHHLIDTDPPKSSESTQNSND
jgi:hypothetical protein